MSSSASEPRILVLGMGAVGSVVADALSRSGCRVSVSSRRPEEDGERRLHALDGSTWKLDPAARVIGNPAAEAAFDVVILAIRGRGDGALAERLKPLIDDRTIVLPLMNGPGYDDHLIDLLGTARVLTGRIYTATERIEPGRYLVHQRGFIELAVPNGLEDDPILEDLCDRLLAGDLPVHRIDDRERVVWRKLAFNVPFGMLEWLHPGKDFNWTLADPANMERVENLQRELKSIAACIGVDLDDDFLSRMRRAAQSTPYYIDSHGGLSIEQDVEFEGFFSHPLAVARELGLETPELESIDRAWRREGKADGEPRGPERASRPGPVPITEEPLHRLIDEALERHASQTVRDDHGVTSFEELGRLAREIAGLLKPGLVVGVLAETGADFMAAHLGTIYAGATVMPLDSSQPPSRIQGLLERGEVDMLLHDHRAPRVVGIMKRIRLPRRFARIRDTDRAPGAGHEGGAQLLATSGSTGEPKLIRNDARFLKQSVARHAAVIGCGPDDRIAAMNSPDVSGTGRDILLSVLTGAGLSWRRLALHGPKGAMEWLRDEEVTVLCTVASIARTVFEAGAPDTRLPRLKSLKITGEPMYSSDFDDFVGFTEPHARLHVGLTSTEVMVATENILRHGDRPERLLSIGWGVPPLRVGIVDDEGNELPPRTPGCMAYADDLFPATEGWSFVSEDVAMMDADGRMTYLGRRDGMLKVAGNRIDIGEVEYNARMIEGVRTCAAYPLEVGDRTLLGLAVEMESTAADVAEVARMIRRRLSSTLPRSVVPHRIQILDAIPRLSTSKPDRTRLAAIAHRTTAAEKTDDEGLGPDERAFLDLIRERASMPGLGFDDSYFDSGGDSISLLRIIAEIEAEHDARIPFSILERDPTPHMLFRKARSAE